MVAGTCSADSIAFLGAKDDTNINCEQSFDYPSFEPIKNDDEDSVNLYNGFKLKYNATYEATDDQKCEGSGMPLTDTINAVCNKETAAGAGVWTEVTTSGCNLELQFVGSEACKLYDVDISKYFAGLTKFIGAISIILGLVLCFVGSKFILIVFGILVFLLAELIMWGILYNTHMFQPEEIEEKKGLILGLGVVVLILGILASYYLAKFADKYAVPLISGYVGGVIAFMLIGGVKIPAAAKLATIVVVAATTVYYSYKVQRFVKSAGTACIGAFILFNGIGKYVGGYPAIMGVQSEGDAETKAIEELNSKEGAMVLFYLGGTIAFTILGTWVQMTYVQVKEEEEDDFMNSKDA